MMDKAKFRKKYLGEVTLKNGEHVKFLFPMTESDVATYQIEAENTFKAVETNLFIAGRYQWALMDDLNLSQFRIVFAAIKKYGDKYWKLTWEQMCKK